MNEINRETMEQDLLIFANKYSINKAKLSTLNFDLDYERNDASEFILKKEKAVIRTLGQVTKVSIGEDEEYKSFEDAEKATKLLWQEYYKNVRANRSPEQRIAEARRQKQYRERRKLKQAELDQRG